MPQKTKPVQPSRRSRAGLDHFDRKILALLVADAGLSYSAIGAKVGLSPPAVHERVKRLRRDGVITQTAARLDGAATGKPLLAFVHVEFDGWGKSRKLMALGDFPEIEEMHSVAGDSGMILKTRTADAHALEQLLARLYALAGIRSTRSYIVLSTFLERPVQAEVTADWPALPMPEA